MPKLDDLRRWARGEKISGLPEIAVRAPKLEEKKPTEDDGQGVANVTTYSARGKYRVKPDKTDVLLQFGVFRGEKASELVKSQRGRKYLQWILENDFGDDIKAACRHQLEEHKRG